MADLGIGHLRLSPEEFWTMTLKDFRRKLKAQDITEQREWERVRLLACYMIQPHLKKNKEIKPKDIVYLPDIDGPKHKPSKQLTEEEKERAKKLAYKWKFK
jgi:hypothetical protein